MLTKVERVLQDALQSDIFQPCYMYEPSKTQQITTAIESEDEHPV